jgi:hypothetical protein
MPSGNVVRSVKVPTFDSNTKTDALNLKPYWQSYAKCFQGIAPVGRIQPMGFRSKVAPFHRLKCGKNGGKNAV